ncbi:hypothetical protein Ciccas_012978 [Cichlidogyrus casuarinus]|uniref:Uncharacterized protein n=1 Tax=Cichlidogyrus casuarinus TaxID=1844966 RepID=A0ABD2PLW5_9PLAT
MRFCLGNGSLARFLRVRGTAITHPVLDHLWHFHSSPITDLVLDSQEALVVLAQSQIRTVNCEIGRIATLHAIMCIFNRRLTGEKSDHLDACSGQRSDAASSKDHQLAQTSFRNNILSIITIVLTGLLLVAFAGGSALLFLLCKRDKAQRLKMKSELERQQYWTYNRDNRLQHKESAENYNMDFYVENSEQEQVEYYTPYPKMLPKSFLKGENSQDEDSITIENSIATTTPRLGLASCEGDSLFTRSTMDKRFAFTNSQIHQENFLTLQLNKCKHFPVEQARQKFSPSKERLVIM